MLHRNTEAILCIVLCMRDTQNDPTFARVSDLIAELRSTDDDGQLIEAKRAKSALPTDLWQTISAFANRRGGTLLLGVHQAARFTVTGVDDPATTINNVASLCSDQMEPPIRAEIAAVTVEGQFVVVVDVPPTPTDQRPAHLRKLGALRGSRLRVADGNRQLSEYEVSLLLAQRTQPAFDRLPVESSSLADLDARAVDRFVDRMRSRNAGIFSTLERWEVLRLLNVIAIREDGGLVPTRAGLLAFGIFPQHFFPQLNVSVVVYPTDVAGQPGPRRERFLDNKSIDGNIAMMLRGTLEVLQRHLKRRGIVHGLIRIDEWEYPIEVLREAVVNALAHRDYSSAALGTQVQIELFPDRLVIRNPGGLFGPVNEETLGIELTSSSRNAALLKVLEDAEAEPGRTICENRGSGIATMRALLGAVGMNPPIFRDEIATFELQISNESLIDQATADWLSSLGLGSLSPSQTMALAYLRRHDGYLTNTSYRKTTGVTDSRQAGRELRDLVDRRALRQDGDRGSARYQLAAASPGLTVAEQILEVLRDGEKSRSEIAELLNVPSQAVASALGSLRDQGHVELIGKPRSRSARWRSVENPT
jgi:ATP-dependent DNA helicase RecG